MKRSLPERPDLGQLKKQAKELCAAVHAGDKAALDQAGIHENERANFALNDAQRVVARDHGFPSWAKLKLHVETRTVDEAEARLLDAVLEGESDVVGAILRERPALATRTPAVAAALGESAAIDAELRRNAALFPAWACALPYHRARRHPMAARTWRGCERPKLHRGRERGTAACRGAQ